MRIKNDSNKQKEIVLLITAGVLTLLLISYFVWLVHHIVSNQEAVFSPLPKDATSAPAFNFEKYDKIILPLFPSANTSSTTASSSIKK